MEPSVLSFQEIYELIQAIEESGQPDPHRGGVRDVMDALPALTAIAKRPNVRAIVDTVLGPEAIVVRSTLFDKTEFANWKVPWHQDVTIAVQERIDHEGYGPWSVKAGIQHVQPPTAILARMVTVRIHLDPCPATNGALRVMPRTHHLGRINQNEVEQYIDKGKTTTCEAEPGDALVMRPLLLHASSPSMTPGHRRVLHYDFAVGDLDAGLEWRMR